MRLLEHYKDDDDIITLHAPKWIWEHHWVFTHKQQSTRGRAWFKIVMRTRDKHKAADMFFETRERVAKH